MAPSTAKPPSHAGSNGADDGVVLIASPTRAQLVPGLRPFYDFWHDDCGGVVPVPRAMIDPLRIPPSVLSKLFLVEALREPRDFRYRLIGTAVAALFGRDSTGKRVAEVISGKEDLDRITGYLKTVTEENVLLYGRERAKWSQKDFQRVAVLLIPATSDGKTTDLILGAVVGLT